jgi:hypothetical protein
MSYLKLEAVGSHRLVTLQRAKANESKGQQLSPVGEQTLRNGFDTKPTTIGTQPKKMFKKVFTTKTTSIK